jgi:hypothetical protein
MLPISHNNIEMLCGMEGVDVAKSVILATTKWRDIRQGGPEYSREEELRNGYWRNMLERGSPMPRFMNTGKSAWDIIELITQKSSIDNLPIPNLSPSERPRKKWGLGTIFRKFFS